MKEKQFITFPVSYIPRNLGEAGDMPEMAIIYQTHFQENEEKGTLTLVRIYV